MTVNKKVGFYVQRGWCGNSILWWKHDNHGYVEDLRQARVFTHEEVSSLLRDDKYVAWKCSHVDECLDAQRLSVNGDYLDSEYKYTYKNFNADSPLIPKPSIRLTKEGSPPEIEDRT